MESLVIMPTWDGFYRGKRVLITGHTGFKGSWLALWLQSLGAQVFGYALQPATEPSLFQQADAGGQLAGSTIADIRDRDALSAAIRKAQPELVFHLAAQALVLPSFADPRETFDVNVMGTVNLLEALRAGAGVRVCVCVTSDKCYENLESGRAYRETDPLGGSNPYSASKGCAELVAASYRRSFFTDSGTSVSTARAGNVIGGGDWSPYRIIPDCIRALSQNKPILLRNPGAVRPWQHVLEPLAGYLTLAAAQWADPARFAQPWNFGPAATDHVTVQQVVEMVIAQWGGGSWQQVPSQSEGRTLPREDGLLKLDISKATSQLGWTPVWCLRQAIEKTVRWYKQAAVQPGSEATRALCLEQIGAYTTALSAAKGS